MQRIHGFRSVAPAVSPLEGRVLLSGASGKAIQGAELVAKVTTEVVVTDQGIYKGHVLKSVELMATVKPATGTNMPTGSVTFDAVMPAGMKMKGMKSGTTDLGTVTLSKGMAMLTVKPRMVLKMPLQVVYSGDANFATSTDSPAALTKSGLKGMSTGMSTGMKV